MPRSRTALEQAAGKLILRIQQEWMQELGEPAAADSEQVMNRAHDLLLAASCHSSSDLQQAQQIGADFALLSPVLPTRSHPDADPLGWDGFARLVADANLPVFALGGMRPEVLRTAWQHGAQGIAGIRGLWMDGQ